METLLADFLQTGKLGSIEFGISVNEVVEVFGLPGLYSDIEEMNRDIAQMKDFAYGGFLIEYGVDTGDLEFHFQNDQLSFFTFHRQEYAEGAYPELHISWLGVLFSMDIAALRNFAEHNNLQIVEMLIPDLAEDVLSIWVPASQIRIRFTDRW